VKLLATASRMGWKAASGVYLKWMEKEKQAMGSLKFSGASVAAFAGGTMLALSMTPASAFTLPSPSIDGSFANTQIDKAYYYRGGYYPYRRYYGGSYHYYRHRNYQNGRYRYY
jgi:hypothetical protein